MTKSYLLKIRGGVEVDSQGKKAGKGPLISEEVSATLGVSQDQYLFQPITFEPGIAAREGGHIYEGVSGTLRSNAGDNQMHVATVINLNKDDVQSKQILDPKGIAPSIYAGDVTPTLTTECKDHLHLLPKVYGISSYSSNSMKSDNPDSGIYEAKTSRSLDRNGGNPACNQGGMIVLEGNGTRPSHRGDGYLESDKMYTLNTIERHGVCYWDGGQTAGTLTANNAGGSQRMPDKNHFQCVIEAHSIGNGQVHDAMSPSKEVCKTLNCMDDPMKVVIVKSEDADR